MNLPPEPEDPALIERMQRGLVEIGREIVDLMRYQEFGGAIEDREAGVAWLAKRGLAVGADRLLVCPGAHSALLAVLSNLASAGDTVCCELLTYPGIRAWASQLGLNLVGLAMDGEGIEADAFEAACRAHAPKALYCNPTLLNPTTATISARRRRALAEIARRNGVAIVEDDAYGLLPVDPPPAFAELAPDITFHVTGLAKTLGAGLRLAYLVLPDARKAWPLRTSLRAATVMASPLSAALATRWITDGTGDALLQAIRRESAARQRLAAGILPAGIYATTPEAFHLWLTLPAPWSRSSFAAQMRSSGLGVVVSDAFYAAPGAPPEAARICLGGALNRAELSHALEFLAHVLSESPAMVSGII
jgi:DNA-binding transcriptional MocR family regulator